MEGFYARAFKVLGCAEHFVAFCFRVTRLLLLEKDEARLLDKSGAIARFKPSKPDHGDCSRLPGNGARFGEFAWISKDGMPILREPGFDLIHDDGQIDRGALSFGQALPMQYRPVGEHWSPLLCSA